MVAGRGAGVDGVTKRGCVLEVLHGATRASKQDVDRWQGSGRASWAPLQIKADRINSRLGPGGRRATTKSCAALWYREMAATTDWAADKRACSKSRETKTGERDAGQLPLRRLRA